MITRKENHSHKIWKNDIVTLEAIIDVSLWNKELINDFQNNLNHIITSINQKSELINTNKKNYISDKSNLFLYYLNLLPCIEI